MNEPKVAIYIRLSLADEDTGYRKMESDSVQHQRMLINDWLDRHPQLKDAPREEFVDDGYTGTNTDRPAFQAMMKKLRTGELNVTVTKDFSRAMRDYTEMGNYLECVFPFLGVRYISINDGYDSDDYKGMTSGMDVVLRNIVYASYSKDLSIKTTTAKYQMMKQGKYVGSVEPYGFKFHPTIRNKLAIDKESAAVVRRIFDMALAGKTTSEIARTLNEEKVVTPGVYYRQKHPESHRFQKRKDENGWTIANIHNILHQYEYTGATVGHKRSKVSLTSKKTVLHDKADWFVVEGMHDAIVSKEEFERVQELLTHYQQRKKRPTNYPLRTIVHCSECRRAMSRRKGANGYYYLCDTSKYDPNATCDRSKHFEEPDIERIVLNAIQHILTLYRKQADKESSLRLTRKERMEDCTAEISRLQRTLERYQREQLRLYEDYIADAMTRESYLKRKSKLADEIKMTEEQVGEQEKLLLSLESQANAQENPLQTLEAAYTGADALTAEMVQAFVQELYLYPDSQVEIVWKFKDLIEPLLAESQEDQHDG
ncbi:MAG: recombinase family protein [Clostridiales bacterium]|nr:recombinase family protein [Clostridiales bacterium]